MPKKKNTVPSDDLTVGTCITFRGRYYPAVEFYYGRIVGVDKDESVEVVTVEHPDGSTPGFVPMKWYVHIEDIVGLGERDAA